MRLVRFRHKGLRQLYADDDPKGLSATFVDKLRKLLFALKPPRISIRLDDFQGGNCTL